MNRVEKSLISAVSLSLLLGSQITFLPQVFAQASGGITLSPVPQRGAGAGTTPPTTSTGTTSGSGGGPGGGDGGSTTPPDSSSGTAKSKK
jgi:hypothetical protein